MIIISDLKQRREAFGKTQQQCADDTKIPIRTLQRYESGEGIGDPEYLLRLMKYFSLNEADIYKS